MYLEVALCLLVEYGRNINLNRMQVFIALGSNLGDRQNTLDSAVEHIRREIGPIERCSNWIESPALLHPLNPGPQPPFLNGALKLCTELGPHQVLRQLKEIEKKHGRIPSAKALRWSTRELDLDLISYGDLILKDEILTLPHPELHLRDFVLRPLMEIAPEWVHPVTKESLKHLLDRLFLISFPSSNSL